MPICWSVRKGRLLRVILLSAIFFAILPVHSALAQRPSAINSHIYDESELVYRTNLIRRQHGLPPLRWNRELSEAASWFSFDSVVNRPKGYCAHMDTVGRSPGDRQMAFGYVNMVTWGENIVCGYAPPEPALAAWMESPAHRENVLSTAFREIGVGYYTDSSGTRGFVTQSFGTDPSYAPVIIEDEAPIIDGSEVSLYIYAPTPQPGFNGIDEVQEMMIANDASFAGATWEPYSATTKWQLLAGQGWRTVYVRLRDGLGRITTASDTIYLGSHLPSDELSLDQASSVEKTVEFSSDSILDWQGIQFRLNWVADDNDPSFAHAGKKSGRITDRNAIGGTAYRLSGANGEGTAALRSTRFYKNVPMEAYICLKVSDNRSHDQVVSIIIEGGGVTYGPLSLRGVDFAKADEYQFFILPFTFHDDPQRPFLELLINKTGETDLFFDAVTFFSTPQPTEETLTWHVPGDYYRGQNVWARLKQEDGAFTRAFELTAASIPAVPEYGTPATPQVESPGLPETTAQHLFLPLTLN